MPQIIKDGVVVEDPWQGQLLSVDEYNEAQGSGLGVQIEPGEGASALTGDLQRLALVAINFPVFTDGRGFSYARELRQRGYQGEIRAIGHFIRDQLAYLQRCGFNAFQFTDEVDLEACLASFEGFTDHYQADVLQAEPLFRRR